MLLLGHILFDIGDDINEPAGDSEEEEKAFLRNSDALRGRNAAKFGRKHNFKNIASQVSKGRQSKQWSRILKEVKKLHQV